MQRKMIVTKPGRYGTRMLQAGDEITLPGPRARAYEALGKVEPPKRKRRVTARDLVALRDEYRTKFGRQPYYGWDHLALRDKIDNAD